MSLWADLQAWTQAQYDALVLANLKRKKKWTAEEINRLLRDRISRRLKAKKGRAIGAEFRRTEGRLPNKLPECQYISGWIASNNVNEDEWLYVWYRHATGQYGPSEQNIFWEEFLPAGSLFYDGELTNSARYRGTMYSGRMREVVQILGGRSEPINYNFQWAETHGIFINQADQSWWVIEIKSGFGVYAWPFPIGCLFTAQEKTRLGVTVGGVPDPSIIQAENKIQLADAGALDVVYSGATPFYPDHGWAFSYIGSEAAIVCITSDENDYQVSTVWQIVINADANGNPSSVTFADIESAFIWGKQEDSPKFPFFLAQYGPCLLSYDMGWHINSNMDKPIGSIKAPLDVFYSPAGVMRIVRYDTLDSYTEQTTIDNMPTMASLCNGGIFLDIEAAGTFEKGSWIRQWSESVTYDFDMGRPYGVSEDQRYSETNDIVTHTQSFENLGTQSYNGANYPISRLIFYNTYSSETIKQSHGTSSFWRSETMFKPFYDRECVGFHYKELYYETQGGGTRYWCQALGGGGAYGSTETGNITELVGDAGYGCGAANTMVFYPNYAGYGICGTVYPTTDTGTALYQVYSAVSDLTLATIPNDPNNCTALAGCVTAYLDSACYSESMPSDPEFTPIEFTKTWLYDNKQSAWQTVYSADAYDHSDAMSEFLDSPIIQGSFRFMTYLDAFTNRGLSYTELNSAFSENMYRWGDPTKHYPILVSGEIPVCSGWIGIPIIND